MASGVKLLTTIDCPASAPAPDWTSFTVKASCCTLGLTLGQPADPSDQTGGWEVLR